MVHQNIFPVNAETKTYEFPLQKSFVNKPRLPQSSDVVLTDVILGPARCGVVRPNPPKIHSDMELTGDGYYNGRLKRWMVKRFTNANATEYSHLQGFLQSNFEQKEIAISYGFNFGREISPKEKKGVTSNTFEAYIGLLVENGENDHTGRSTRELNTFLDDLFDNVYVGLRPYGTFPPMADPQPQWHIPFHPSHLGTTAFYPNGTELSRYAHEYLFPPQTSPTIMVITEPTSTITKVENDHDDTIIEIAALPCNLLSFEIAHRNIINARQALHTAMIDLEIIELKKESDEYMKSEEEEEEGEEVVEVGVD